MVRSSDRYCGLRVAELGVATGHFSHDFLKASKNCVNRYYAIDTWRQQVNNYVDGNSWNNEGHHAHMAHAMQNLKTFWPHVSLIQEETVIAARLLDDSSLDFVLIDARHDFCAVHAELRAYWRKLRPGGIMAGHDYLTHAEAIEQLGKMYDGHQDWRVCANGTIRTGAVKGAVHEFASSLGLEVRRVFHLAFGHSPYWIMHKPPS
ncbi:unnamed protein product [Polarella glacialis]|uniref:Methyltransferase domain-containing protein n=1 Tax=Polarella glacialis TaxID=89957 RepID=A0A813E474_POLGL|nr:unnamed protein product [Polarella glacialis]